MRLVIIFRTALLCCLVLAFVVEAWAQVSSRQARRLITRLPGFELPNSAVRVKSVSGDRATAQVRAAIETAFRLKKDETGNWQVREFRTGPDRWEEIDLIAWAIAEDFQPPPCDGPDFPVRANGVDPSARRVRCLLAGLAGIQIPSDAVRIRDVSPFNIPLASQPSALAVAILDMDFRFVRDGSGWRISQVRTGNREWTDLPRLVDSVNKLKRQRARTELEAQAAALEAFRQAHGFYVPADNHTVLIDHLSPTYLDTVIRLDPWHRSYLYEGSQGQFTLRSTGPDGRENTADDIVLAVNTP